MEKNPALLANETGFFLSSISPMALVIFEIASISTRKDQISETLSVLPDQPSVFHEPGKSI